MLETSDSLIGHRQAYNLIVNKNFQSLLLILWGKKKNFKILICIRTLMYYLFYPLNNPILKYQY